MSPAVRSYIYQRDGMRCQYYGVPVVMRKLKKNVRVPADTATIDHVIPRSKGGTGIPENSVTCCYNCNNILGDKCCTDNGDIFQVFKHKRNFIRQKKGVNHERIPEFIKLQRLERKQG